MDEVDDDVEDAEEHDDDDDEAEHNDVLRPVGLRAVAGVDSLVVVFERPRSS